MDSRHTYTTHPYRSLWVTVAELLTVELKLWPTGMQSVLYHLCVCVCVHTCVCVCVCTRVCVCVCVCVGGGGGGGLLLQIRGCR